MTRAGVSYTSDKRLWITYWRLDRRNQGHLQWGSVQTLFDRRKPLHWLVAICSLIRDGRGIRGPH